MSGAAGYAASIAFVVAVVGAVALLRAATGSATQRMKATRGGDEQPSVEIGKGQAKHSRPVALGLDELQQGALVGGSPGAGKSTLLAAMSVRLPPAVGSLFVDLKGDRSMATRLGIPDHLVFGLGDRCAAAWSPLDAGNPASWRDILMATQHWSEPHYRQAAARYVGACLAALAATGEEVELDAVIWLLEQPKRATGLVRALPEREAAMLARAEEAISVDSSLRSGVLGLANRLALLRDSAATAGRFGRSGIDLGAVLRGERVLFSLPAGEFPEEAPAIAAAVIQSFGAAGQRLATGDERLRALLVVDEAPRLGGEQLREAVAIGRGAGIGTVVAVQDFADLDYVAPGTREAVETGANTHPSADAARRRLLRAFEFDAEGTGSSAGSSATPGPLA